MPTQRFIAPDPSSYDAHQRATHESVFNGPRAVGSGLAEMAAGGVLPGPFGPLIALGEVGHHLADTGEALRFRGHLDDRLRELIILLVATRRRSRFEWAAHARIGRALGITDEELSQLATGDPSGWADERERTVLVTAATLMDTSRLDDEQFARARSALDQRELLEVCAVVGYYSTLALMMGAFGIEP